MYPSKVKCWAALRWWVLPCHWVLVLSGVLWGAGLSLLLPAGARWNFLQTAVTSDTSHQDLNFCCVFLIYCRTFWGWWAGAAPSTGGGVSFPTSMGGDHVPQSLSGCPGWRSSPCAFLLPWISAVCAALLALRCPACPFPSSSWM